MSGRVCKLWRRLGRVHSGVTRVGKDARGCNTAWDGCARSAMWIKESAWRWSVGQEGFMEMCKWPKWHKHRQGGEEAWMGRLAPMTSNIPCWFPH